MFFFYLKKTFVTDFVLHTIVAVLLVWFVNIPIYNRICQFENLKNCTGVAKHFSNMERPDMVEHVYGLIDSKIQQIDFKTKQVINSFVDLDAVQVSPPKYGLGEIPSLESTLANNERVLSQIESYSRTMKLLLLMRAKVNLDNAILVMYLLEENKYLTVKKDLLDQVLESPFKYKNTPSK